jgi:hypothetical protein
MTVHPENDESRRVTLAACALVATCQLAFAIMDLPLFGAVAAGIDLAHSAMAVVAGLWLWRRRRSERAYELVFAILTLMFLPAILASEVRGAELGRPRDPLIPLQFVMLGVAVLAPGRAKVGGALLAIVAATALGFWIWLRHRSSTLGVHAEPWMTLVYAGVAATLLGLRGLRIKVIRELARARAEADALARVARLFLAVRDQTNTPLQTLTFATALLARRLPESVALLARMNNAIARLRELSSVFAATEAWPREEVRTDVDLAREIEAAARELARTLGREAE